MSNISTEQKLQLIRQVRSQHSRDQSDLMARERILYGRTGDYHSFSADIPDPAIADPAAAPKGRSLFGIRLLAALVLLVLFILLDRNDSPFLGVSTSEVFHIIENDYYKQLEEWIHETQNGG